VPIISDAWPGLQEFFVPGREILVARTAEDTLRALAAVGDEEARRIAIIIALLCSRRVASQPAVPAEPCATTARWRRLPSFPGDTVGRSSLVYDEHDRQVVLFGEKYGPGSQDPRTVQLWALSLPAHQPARWRQLVAGGRPPSPSTTTGVSYDPTGQRLIVLDAGILGSGPPSIWELPLSVTPATWRKVTPAGRQVPCTHICGGRQV
jgi:hypothetical protein